MFPGAAGGAAAASGCGPENISHARHAVTLSNSTALSLLAMSRHLLTASLLDRYVVSMPIGMIRTT